MKYFILLSIVKVSTLLSNVIAEDNLRQDHLVSKFLKMIHETPSIFKDYVGPLLHVNEEEAITFDCMDLFKEKDTSVPVAWPPPQEIPSNLFNQYTMGNASQSFRIYIDTEKQSGGAGYNWTSTYIDELMKKPNVCGGYQNSDGLCDKVFKRQKEKFIKGKNGLVIGSQWPWAEAALLAEEAAHVTTIEYMSIVTNDTRLSAYTPAQVASKFVANQMELFDFIFSYSSIEHDGLGRYGDPLNPFGDLEEVAKMYCLLKPGGILMLGFPVGIDGIFFNAHRMYGPKRLKAIMSFWKLIDAEGDFVSSIQNKNTNSDTQPIFILQKKSFTHKKKLNNFRKKNKDKQDRRK